MLVAGRQWQRERECEREREANVDPATVDSPEEADRGSVGGGDNVRVVDGDWEARAREREQKAESRGQKGAVTWQRGMPRRATRVSRCCNLRPTR